MISGLHSIIYAEDADKVRAFFRDVLGLPFADAGHGWLIFGLPPSEIAAHPIESPGGDSDPGLRSGHHQLYLMADDIHATVAKLKAKGVEFTAPITDQGWGILTEIRIPGGGTIGLYQPRHPRPPQPKA